MSKCNFLILGFSRTGSALYEYLKNKYPHGNIFIYDDNKNDIPNKITNIENLQIDKCFASPVFRTIHNPQEIILDIQKRNIPIYSDIEFFIKENPDKKYIGITGTNGKSTTTALVGYCLQKYGIRATSCGNIGKPIFSINPNNYDYFIVEISSAQLEISQDIQFDYGILLNLAEDHVDYHGSIEAYYKIKIDILKKSIVGIANKNLNLTEYMSFDELSDADFLHFKLKGTHNKQNIEAALTLARCMNLDTNRVLRIAHTFNGLEHRMEFVTQIDKITYINDSKATSVSATITALKTIENKIILIAGGKYKGDDVSQINEYKNICHIFLIGESIKEFQNQITIPYTYSYDIQTAIDQATAMAKELSENITILFSPFCASFDQFQNFEDRGNIFKKIVLNEH